jgi:two-component system copper resistance phosphate regulon response regulator CusR
MSILMQKDRSHPPMRILIIEDEQKMSSYLHKGLTEASFTVDIANDGRHGLFLALHDEFDLIVLDVMLPEIDGLEVLKRLREQKQTQVLLLTARDGLDDKVKAFELGADDYLAKPFAYAEFLARIRTLLRRAPRVNVPLDLTEQEFALLQLLAQRRGEVLTRTFITSQIWGINSDSDSNVVDVAVGRLRAKIDSFFDKKLLHTVRGMGYVLEDKSLT